METKRIQSRGSSWHGSGHGSGHGHGSGSGSQMPNFQRTNSSFRLSRTSTNTNTNTNANTTEPYYDNQSLRTLDRIPSTKPSITYLDKLWTQIDVLDDVKNMSNQVREKGSFFNDQFNEELNKLKHLQEKLVEVMANQQINDKNGVDGPKQRYRNEPTQSHRHMGTTTNTTISEANLDHSDDEAQTSGKFKDFFEEKHKTSNNVIYKKQNFDEINSYINEVKKNLDSVSQSMQNFDETTRDLW